MLVWRAPVPDIKFQNVPSSIPVLSKHFTGLSQALCSAHWFASTPTVACFETVVLTPTSPDSLKHHKNKAKLRGCLHPSGVVEQTLKFIKLWDPKPPLRPPDIGVKLGINVLKAWWTCVLRPKVQGESFYKQNISRLHWPPKSPQKTTMDDSSHAFLLVRDCKKFFET